ncbi:hypothetical protein D6779_09585 [Candidatus Parcubacteria bacterium]|nr:MAG: hypothetical protein D6779_09585 [Candidatus Parcubacteria bacterium]
MTYPTTRESLGIFWNGEEVDGLLVYGLWVGEVTKPPRITFDHWPPGTEAKARRLFGADWTIWLWEIRIVQWPSSSAWSELVKSLLNQIVDADAIVAWAGLEGMFVEPPDLFHKDKMGGGVWAAVLPSRRQFGIPGLDEPFQPLDEHALDELHRIVTSSLST